MQKSPISQSESVMQLPPLGANDWHVYSGSEPVGFSAQRVPSGHSTSYEQASPRARDHDQFGTQREQRRLQTTAGVYLLDGATVELDGLSVGGLGGIVGNPRKPHRREQHDFLDTLEDILDVRPSLLVLHEGPSGAKGQRGNAFVRNVLAEHGTGLTVCGHAHWHAPLAAIGPDAQVLNVDARVVVLLNASREARS